MSTADTAPEIPAAFVDLPFTAPQHLRLALFGIIARIVESCTDGDISAALKAHPFLREFLSVIHARTDATDTFAASWLEAVAAWERQAVRANSHLPLVALRQAGLNTLEIELLVTVGLVEEDPRFTTIFEGAQGGERRPTFALLTAWWQDDGSDDDRPDEVRTGLQRLIDHGLVRLRNPDAPRAEWVPTPVLPVWDVLRGDAPTLPWLEYVAVEKLTALDNLVFSEAVRTACTALPPMLTSRPAPLLVLRGPSHNGRKTLAGALARSLAKPIVIAREAVFEDESRWRLLGALAAMTGALVIVERDLAPGDSRVVPPLPLAGTPVIVVTGRHGAWVSPDPRPVLTIDVPLPDRVERMCHWQSALSPAPVETLPAAAAEMRLSSGNIRAVAAAAAAGAKLAGREAIDSHDLRRACRTLQSARLETIATRLDVRGTLSDIAVDDATREELDALVARCRWREELASAAAGVASASVGVRALFAGPSGSGKTLAARLLAADLAKDLYRVDLAAAVNKYLGETEKNLNRAFAAAEELDVVLLIDEGDALMANRTDVGSSNDRYANLETNFLLQRIESFEGILLVTTNAPDRIDRAFTRRMDVVVQFRSPDAWRRLEILRRHLGETAIDDTWLEDAANRCALSGGQLRNVVLHARLLSLQNGRPLDETHLQAALAREYRKTGASCPIRPLQAKPCPR